MTKGVCLASWSPWMAHQLLFLCHGSDSEQINQDTCCLHWTLNQALCWQRWLQRCHITLSKERLWGFFFLFGIAGWQLSLVPAWEQTCFICFCKNLLFLKKKKIIWYKYFCHSFCPTVCLQAICRSLARLALGTCGQTLDSISIDACSCKLLLPQNARVKLSLATENFPSIWGGQVAVTTWFTEAHPTRVC